MKKRIISMLLTVMMVMSLFSGLTVSADAATYNGANTIEYTMAQGDFVLRICQRLGLNYYTCKNAIMILNNITDGQWNKLTVGRTLILPASDYDALLITNGAGTTTYNSGAAATTATTSNVAGATVLTGTATTGTATTLNTAATVAAATSDKLAYYLVPYTMSYGETVSGVCNALGVNFSIFSPFIKQVNNITNWSKVRAGDTLVIPTPVAPAVGTTCYGVMEHAVGSSDTAYGIVSSKGVNYNANERLLKVLNQTDNLGAIRAGGKFFYPVPLTVSVPGTGNPGSTATTTTTTTVTDGNGTTTTSTTTTSKLYKLTGGMSASDGSMLFYVDSNAVTAAPAGAKVTVVTATNPGKAIQSLTVKYADSSADLRLSGDTFIMPACDARVDAVIQTGHDINIVSNYSGKVSATVGGISVQSAVKGSAVLMKSTDPNYEIESVSATWKRFSLLSTKTSLPITNKGFAMPDGDVTVEVTLKPVSSYSFYVMSGTDGSASTANGSFFLQVNGSAVTRAAKGTQVTVVPKAMTGYEPSKIEVREHNGTKIINVLNNTFTMPGFDVDVWVYFMPKGNNITLMPAAGGTVSASVGGVGNVTEANTGDTVSLYATPLNDPANNEVYVIDRFEVVRNLDGLKVNVTQIGSAYQFTMPEGGVTVTPVFRGASGWTITSAFYVNSTTSATTPWEYKDCSFSISFADPTDSNGKRYTAEFTMTDQSTATPAAYSSVSSGDKHFGILQSQYNSGKIYSGTYIDLRPGSEEGTAFTRFEIYSNGAYDEERSNQANKNGYFEMPAANVVIRAFFETGKTAIGQFAILDGDGSVSYRVNGKSAATCAADDTVELIPTPSVGYKFNHEKYTERLFVTRKDNGARITLKQNIKEYGTDGKIKYATYSFKMPASGVDIKVSFDALPFIIKMKAVNEVGKSLPESGLWQIAINGDIGAVDNDKDNEWTEVEVAYGDYIQVAMTEAGYSKYDMTSFRIDGMEYIGDVLNYFYNFQMIESRAKDLEIVATLRPKVTETPSIHRLVATYLPNMGNVGFFLVNGDPTTGANSGTGYASNVDGVDYYAKVSKDSSGKYSITDAKYTSYAFAGDYVVIAANSNDGHYGIKEDDIVITPVMGDANRIRVSQLPVTSIDGDTNNGSGFILYYFRMPDDDVSISVNFKAQKYEMHIHVTDENGNKLGGMIDLYVQTSVFSDVAADRTFGEVDFNQLVTIMPSTRARAENMAVTKADVKTAGSAETVYYYDYSASEPRVTTAPGSGPIFNMPACDVDVYITVEKLIPITTHTFQYRLNGGSLVFLTGPNVSFPVASDYDVGDEIYIFEVPAAGKEHLGKGDLNITNNGIVYTAANWHAELADGTNVWKFKVPSGVTMFTATWGDPEDTLALDNLIYAPASAIIGGTAAFKQGGTSVAEYDPAKGDLTIELTKDSAHNNATKDDITVKDATGADVPFDFDETTQKVTIKSDKLPKGGVYVSVNFPTSKVRVNFKLDLADGTKKAMLALGTMTQYVTTDNAADCSWEFEPGTVIVISSADSRYNAVKAQSTHYGNAWTDVLTSINYVVPVLNADETNETITIALASVNPAVTVTLGTDSSLGTIALSHENNRNMIEQPSAFGYDHNFYFFASPAYGYKLDEANLVIVENVSGTQHRIAPGDIVLDAETYCYQISSLPKIPAGGITIYASYVAKSIPVNFTFVEGHKGTVQVSDGTNTPTIQDAANVTVPYGTTITMTPVGNFQWGTNAAKIGDTAASGSGNTGARSFTVNTESAVTVTLDVIEK